MASSAHKQPRQQPNVVTPPPTPSTETNHFSTSSADDTLSKLLHRLPPPTLSLSISRRSPRATTTTPLPAISLCDQTTPSLLLSSFSQIGFFQLTDHSVPSQLANSAESDSLSLFKLPTDKKDSCFPKTWPLGYSKADEDGLGESFCLESSCFTESNTELELTSLHEFTSEMEKVGLKVIELIAREVGFENPVGEEPIRGCSLMWVSEDLGRKEPVMTGGFYPYVVGLQYQIRLQKYYLLADSGWAEVLPNVDSILVTLGDIAQVWSNGKVKKVRGRPMACLGDSNMNSTSFISMTLLITLPMDSVVSPILPKPNDGDEEEEEEKKSFRSFSFEDYAWRIYHERFPFNYKDTLDRYRI